MAVVPTRPSLRGAGPTRIAAAFAAARAGGRAALVPYVVAGYPDAETSFAVALACIDNGADLLEVGLPYSDPLADGATLQRASAEALRAGTTFDVALDLVRRIATARPATPVVPMAYVNQIIGGGDGAVTARRLADAGASGLIVADLTLDEGRPFEAVAAGAGLALIYLVAPTTSPDRRRRIASRTTGFLYLVSLVGVTGARSRLASGVGRLVREVRAASSVPVAVGFGISRPAHVRAIAGAGADGVIVASALVDALGHDGRDVASLGRLVAALRAATGPTGQPRRMAAAEPLRIYLEVTPKRSFAVAVEWPGWARAGKTPEAAIEALLAYRGRYADAVRPGGLAPPDADVSVDIAEQLEGNASTEFGVPGTTAAADRRPIDLPEALRRAAIVEAAWATFDRTAAVAPAELRKGPRGGGRDTAKIVAHVVASDAGYSRELDVRLAQPDPADAAAVAALHTAMLDVLRRPSDGSAIVKRWTTRYAAQRIAWHALDHAWEIEDRSTS